MIVPNYQLSNRMRRFLSLCVWPCRSCGVLLSRFVRRGQLACDRCVNRIYAETLAQFIEDYDYDPKWERFLKR